MIKTNKLNILNISFGSLTIRILDVGGTTDVQSIILIALVYPGAPTNLLLTT